MIFRSCILSLALLCSLLCAPLSCNDEAPAAIEESQVISEPTHETIHELVKKVETLVIERDQLENELKVTRQQLTNATGETQGLKNEKEQSARRVQELEEKITDLNMRLRDAESATHQHFKEAEKALQAATEDAVQKLSSTALHIQELQRTIIKLHEKVNDCSWSDAFDKHIFKLAGMFAAGSLTTYAILKYACVAAASAEASSSECDTAS